MTCQIQTTRAEMILAFISIVAALFALEAFARAGITRFTSSVTLVRTHPCPPIARLVKTQRAA